MIALTCEAESTVFADGVDTGLQLLEVAEGQLTFFQCCWVDACSPALTIAAVPVPEPAFFDNPVVWLLALSLGWFIGGRMGKS